MRRGTGCPSPRAPRATLLLPAHCCDGTDYLMDHFMRRVDGETYRLPNLTCRKQTYHRPYHPLRRKTVMLSYPRSATPSATRLLPRMPPTDPSSSRAQRRCI